MSIVKFEKFYSKNMNGNKINNCKYLIVLYIIKITLLKSISNEFR